MEKIKSLNRYQKAVLIVMIAMALVFAGIYSMTISRVGFAYRGAILVPSQENGSTVYSGRVQGRQARFTVSEDKTVVFQHGDKTYGEYTIDMAINSCTKAYQEKNPNNVLEKIEPLRILRETDKAVLVKYQSPDDAVQKLTEWLPKSKCEIEQGKDNHRYVMSVAKGIIEDKRIPILKVNPLIKK